MSKPRDVRAARCNSWVHYRLEVPDSWAMPKENLFAASPRQKWQLCSEAAGGTGTLWECGALMVKSLPWDLAFFNSNVKEPFGHVHIQNCAVILSSDAGVAVFSVFSASRSICGGSLCCSCSQIRSHIGAKFGCRVNAQNGDSLLAGQWSNVCRNTWRSSSRS